MIWTTTLLPHCRQKILNIFHFNDFVYFVGRVGYTFIRITFIQADITFGYLIHNQ